MDPITVTLGGVTYTGAPLRLKHLRRLRKTEVAEFDLDVVAMWLAEASPKVDDPENIAASPPAIAIAVKTILEGSGFVLGEAGAGAA